MANSALPSLLLRMIDLEIWGEYLEAMRQLETSVRLTAFWTRETALFTKECADQAEISADAGLNYLSSLSMKEMVEV